jgi:hypothetical protein
MPTAPSSCSKLSWPFGDRWPLFLLTLSGCSIAWPIGLSASPANEGDKAILLTAAVGIAGWTYKPSATGEMPTSADVRYSSHARRHSPSRSEPAPVDQTSSEQCHAASDPSQKAAFRLCPSLGVCVASQPRRHRCKSWYLWPRPPLAWCVHQGTTRRRGSRSGPGTN